MERINPFSFYEFGKEIQALIALQGNVSTQHLFWPLFQVRGKLQALLVGKPIPVGISAGKVRSALESIDAIFDARFQTKGADGAPVFRMPDPSDEPVVVWQMDWVRRTVAEFETVFAEEMRETATYFVPRRGIYHTPALVDEADGTFPAELQPIIPQKAKDDWKAAGRCLAFNLLSASGFHVARAVEACLESYYQLFSGKPGATLHGWKAYIDALQKIADNKPTPCPSKKTLTELDQMREDYRNPIVHPRVVLTESDARMLFANGESLIIAMAQEMADAAAGVQPALVLEGGSDTRTIEPPDASKFPKLAQKSTADA
ncbi:HEPN domain-containing protein [Bradyrhizobium sp. BRP22]|uniref:hypothetical protein n=1 Tax=Bradyrhizobium sp. BRP22 TaxID=2793821 RepID=UPI001CD646F2|nr:hypothetical protein [Bradyrhizobium sp. BRP22]MCA1457750.1 HEPN domain-containing protein [Bradyrhizobium sp. BRP22]